MRNAIRFLLGDEPRELEDVTPSMTILNYLRNVEKRYGTKEGCAEGDCGACTVVLGELKNDKIHYHVVNSCIRLMPSLNGKQLLTVEDLAHTDGKLHPVQAALVENNASQCGFCTPGFAMSLFTLYQEDQVPTKARVNDVLAGNLCRCTGYGPIIDAAQTMKGIEGHELDNSSATELLRQWNDDESIQMSGCEKQYFAPVTISELVELLARYPDATILAGGTDVGLWVTKLHKDLTQIIYIGDVSELNHVQVEEDKIRIGATVNVTRAKEVFGNYWPEFGELLRRFGSTQIRNAGTVGGNIANGSPIGDSPPALMALNASVTLYGNSGERKIPLEEFYIDYGVQNIKPGEFLKEITIPLPESGDHFRAYKISKRFDQDISTLLGAFKLTLKQNKVVDINICFGGMAATPKHAKETEKALVGKSWSEESIAQALIVLDSEFDPITDMRGSADYRRNAAKNLLQKFFNETTNCKGLKTSVLEYYRECLNQ